MGGASDGPTDCVIQPIDPASEKALEKEATMEKSDIKRTISLDFQLTDIQELQKTLRSMSEDEGSRCCPSLFDRAAKSWWNPRFDSDILEGQFWQSTFPRTTRRFQFGLAYLLLLCLTWAIYFPVLSTPHWYMFLACSLSAGTMIFLMFLVTVTPLYTKHCFKGKVL